ncbi:cation diffusion facilitator family transporter [Flexithrix dorotheae]|uniref:cation diffusion facilitator family transporter n=1 Tax=Flexithrix dorotheae TaxID=70993 RepID=UPI00037F13E7|nr:cation diffusion facilitator family transporter [Flexithrix dorotheae]
MPVASKENIRVQSWVVIVSLLLLIVKFIAFYATHSIAILTDALESIVNVTAGFVGLYSLKVSARPKDANHPYGHGKIELVSAALEGSMIILAGGFIIYKSALNLIVPPEIEKLDFGILLVLFSGIANYLLGYYCIKVAQKTRSMALKASGKHLITDTYSTIGIILGLGLLYLTGFVWIDSLVAAIFGFIIIYTGLRIIRSTISGIMDEADEELISELVQSLNEKRRENWIDIHNLRILKYGNKLHLDCHFTVPWYLTVKEAHMEVEEVAKLAEDQFGEVIELFVHTDGCQPHSCGLCIKSACSHRKKEFVKKLTWDIKNITNNKSHRIETNA